MQKIIRLALMLLLLAALALANTRLSEQTAESVQSSTKADEKERKVVIDAGHGGKDPGKVGEGGILEKDLNLQIAKKAGEELQKTGVQVIYTRTEDEELGEGEEGGRKLADMEARTELINRTRPDLTVSIHQNSYTDPSVRGIQVFYYSGSQEGEWMARQMERVFAGVEKGRIRESKANGDYYLLKRTEVPTLIVECGFLSCPEELDLLTDESYQQELAHAIAEGILACVGD